MLPRLPYWRWVHISGVVLVLLALLMPIHVAHADVITVSTVANMNLRAAPDIGAAILIDVPAGTNLTALGRDSQTFWILVNFGGQQGWLFAADLNRSAPLSNLPVVAAGTATLDIVPEVPPTRAITLVAMNVRAGPGLDFPIIGGLPAKQHLSLDGKSGDWYRFAFTRTQEGWLFAPFVATDGSEANLPNIP